MDGHWSKLTVIRQKVGGPDELKDKSVRSKTTKTLFHIEDFESSKFISLMSKAESLETLKGY